MNVDYAGVEYAASFGRCEVWTRAEGIQAVKESRLGTSFQTRLYMSMLSCPFLCKQILFTFGSRGDVAVSEGQQRMLDLRSPRYWRGYD